MVYNGDIIIVYIALFLVNWLGMYFFSDARKNCVFEPHRRLIGLKALT